MKMQDSKHNFWFNPSCLAAGFREEYIYREREREERERERERERTAWFTEGGRERERARQANGEERKIEILWEEKGEGVIRKGACVYCVYT